MKKILVTGGTGLVGSQFNGLEFLKIGSKDLNLLSQLEVQNFFKDHNIEGVIHCAARVGGILGNMTKQAEFFYENAFMNTVLIEEARKANVKKFVSFLSTCVFPDDVEYPLTVDKIHKGKPHSSNYGYAYAKRMADIQLQTYQEQYGLSYFSVIPSNIYGPNDFYNLNDGHVIPSLIHKMYIAQKKNTDMIIWGSGNPLREFIFSKDVANLTTMLYYDYQDNSPVILSSDEEISIKDLVGILAELFNFKGNIKFDDSKPDGQFRKPSDNTKIKDLYPNYTFTNIYNGLKESVEWFIQNYEYARK